MTRRKKPDMTADELPISTAPPYDGPIDPDLDYLPLPEDVVDGAAVALTVVNGPFLAPGSPAEAPDSYRESQVQKTEEIAIKALPDAMSVLVRALDPDSEIDPQTLRVAQWIVTWAAGKAGDKKPIDTKNARINKLLADNLKIRKRLADAAEEDETEAA